MNSDSDLQCFLILQVFIFIVFLIFRCGQGGDIFLWGSGDGVHFTTPASSATTTSVPASSTSTVTSSAKAGKVNGSAVMTEESDRDRKIRSVGDSFSERAENDLVFGIMTSVGYFFIVIILMIGIIMGDKPTFSVPNQNFMIFKGQNISAAAVVQCLWISVFPVNWLRANPCVPECYLGMFNFSNFSIILLSQGKATADGMGSMAIITSFIFLVDTVFTVLDARKNE